jgi:hypothetical protein
MDKFELEFSTGMHAMETTDAAPPSAKMPVTKTYFCVRSLVLCVRERKKHQRSGCPPSIVLGGALGGRTKLIVSSM